MHTDLITAKENRSKKTSRRCIYVMFLSRCTSEGAQRHPPLAQRTKGRTLPAPPSPRSLPLTVPPVPALARCSPVRLPHSCHGVSRVKPDSAKIYLT